MRINCLSNFGLNSLNDDKTASEIEDKIDNLKILSEQLRRSLPIVKECNESREGWHKISLTVVPWVCDTVVDPRVLPGYQLKEIEVSRVGGASLIVAGDPIPQLGEEDVAICIESGEVRSLKAQGSIVAKPLFSVKEMIEAGQFLGFCEQGGFVFDTNSCNIDWFREEHGDYILDIWLVPHKKANNSVEEMDEQGFPWPSKWPTQT